MKIIESCRKLKKPCSICHMGTISFPDQSRWVHAHHNAWQLERFLDHQACMRIQSTWSTPMIHTVKVILCYNTSMSLLLSSLLPWVLDSEGEITDSICLLLSNHPPCFDLSINNRLSVRACTAQSGRLFQMVYSRGLLPMLQRDWPEWENKLLVALSPRAQQSSAQTGTLQVTEKP